MWRIIGIIALLLTLLPTLFFDLCFAIGTIGRGWMMNVNDTIEKFIDRMRTKP